MLYYKTFLDLALFTVTRERFNFYNLDIIVLLFKNFSLSFDLNASSWAIKRRVNRYSLPLQLYYTQYTTLQSERMNNL